MKKILHIEINSKYIDALGSFSKRVCNRYLLSGLLIIFLTGIINNANAATFIITSNTNWSAISGGPPGATDVVTVKNGATLTIDISTAECGELNLGSGNPSGGDGTVSFNSGSILTIITSTATVFIGKATGGGFSGYIDMTAGGKLICRAMTHVAGTFTSGSGTVELQSTATITLPSAFTTYNNLTMNNTGTLQLGVNTVLTGNLDILDGTFDTDGASSYSLDISGNLNIVSPASFNANNSVMTLKSNLTNTGTFNNGSSTLTFDGTGAQIINGNNIKLYEFIVNKSSGLLTLDVNVDADKIQLNSGNVLLDNCNLNIDVSGLSGGGSSSYVITDGTSHFSEGIAAIGPYIFHVGDLTNYTPFTITINSATFSGSDSVTLNVKDSKHPSMGIGDHIKRYWTVDAGGFTALNYDVSYIYVDGDIQGTEADLISASWDGSNWTQYFMVNAAANTLFSVGGITTIPSGFAFSGGGSIALPIQLVTFTAEIIENDKVELAWATVSELNNDYFTLERSDNHNDFYEVTQVMGSGNSIFAQEYSTVDEKPLFGTVYYRLKQTDFNGEFEYSDVISVTMKLSKPEFDVFPNPSNGSGISLRFKNQNWDKVLVVLYNTNGELIYSEVVLQDGFTTKFALGISETLSPGIYFVVGSSNDQIYQQRLIIQ
ncbi:MAG: T9SS type A sorting domain-containing protein [Bacteroidetes bacterium]|nr:T9SS type A sorting domain-containing protein [Bacteroidota bacterium]